METHPPGLDQLIIGGRLAVAVKTITPRYYHRHEINAVIEMQDIDAEHIRVEYDDGTVQVLRWAERFNPDQPRDDHGRWTDGGGSDSGGTGTSAADGKDAVGDKDGHPGPGYSASAKVINGVIHTSNVYDATRALSEGKKVELNQPRQVATLLTHLGEVAKNMIAMGKEAPNFNLCNVSVKGTNLFCAESKGIPRIEMPQMDKQQTKDFLKSLEKQGYTITREKEEADHLRATQNELHGVKVASAAEKMRAGDKKAPRLVVSRDNYILDGHHRWAAVVGLDAADNKLTEKMKVSRVDIGIIKLLKLANEFTGGKGHVKSFFF